MGFMTDAFDLIRQNQANPDPDFPGPFGGLADPVGTASRNISGLQGQIITALGGGRDASQFRAGQESGEALLRRGGRTGGRELDLKKSAIEQRRQQLQQDISQSSAASGLAGAFGTGALQTQGNLAAQDQKAQAAEEQALEEDARRRQDLAGIFQSVIQPGGTLVGARLPAKDDPRPTGLMNVFRTGGNVLGAAGQFFGG
jgi:hypothetical protein